MTGTTARASDSIALGVTIVLSYACGSQSGTTGLGTSRGTAASCGTCVVQQWLLRGQG
jgi:hypothetical protein